MAEAYIGEIRLFGFNFAPRGWMLCQGQTLSISSNTALFSLLGTTYGGNGTTTFNLPDLRGRVAVGQGNGPGINPVDIGQIAGNNNVSLVQPNMPAHNHVVQATASVAIPALTTVGTAQAPSNTTILAQPTDSEVGAVVKLYANGPADTTLEPFNAAVNGPTSIAGGSQPFDVSNPYLGLNYAICTNGIFPSRN
jgi:microcystin-dependent protein